jgi:hypothetical protein
VKKFSTYRNGHHATLGEFIKAALGDYQARSGARPVALVVNPKAEQEAKQALETLGLALDVTSSGGVLLGEVWLQQANTKAVGRGSLSN